MGTHGMTGAAAPVAALALFHVVGKRGYHPANVWERRSDGLYYLAGSAYAFTDADVQPCTATRWGQSCGCTYVTVDWHVYAGGRWQVEPVPMGRTTPVNVWVSEERMAPVVYRHQAAQCRGECRLECGHLLTYGCDCDTIRAEADMA